MTRHNIYRSHNSDPENRQPGGKTLITAENSEANSPSPEALAHYNSLPRRLRRLYYKKGIREELGYGVQQTRRILTMGLFHKQHDEICRFLSSLGLSPRQRDAIFKLLEFYCHYGKVYPKAKQVADDEYISKRTFWYAIAKLRNMGLIQVVNRYFNHRQISNLYRLDKLVVMIARLLAEHGHNIGNFGIKLVSLLAHFWQEIGSVEINLSLAAPIKLKMAGG